MLTCEPAFPRALVISLQDQVFWIVLGQDQVMPESRFVPKFPRNLKCHIFRRLRGTEVPVILRHCVKNVRHVSP